jgi:2-methylaconitate cis-trans-isomerase PrpF
MRGGTSKGLYFHEGDLPPAGPDRDALLLRVMGSRQTCSRSTA